MKDLHRSPSNQINSGDSMIGKHDFPIKCIRKAQLNFFTQVFVVRVLSVERREQMPSPHSSLAEKFDALTIGHETRPQAPRVPHGGGGCLFKRAEIWDGVERPEACSAWHPPTSPTTTPPAHPHPPLWASMETSEQRTAGCRSRDERKGCCIHLFCGEKSEGGSLLLPDVRGKRFTPGSN